MLTRLTPALAILLAACGPAGPASNQAESAAAGNEARSATATPGWTSGRNAQGPYLQYAWGDPSGALFGGICEGHPVLLLDGGDYAAAPTFELIVDDARASLETYEDENGRALFVDDPAIIDRIANAQRRIAFRVGAWSRELSPNPAIARFVRECRAAAG